MSAFKYRTLLFSVALGGSLSAQNNTVASGADFNGSGGSISQSLGQVVYSPLSNSSHIVTQGVQQTYEVVVDALPEFMDGMVEAVVYPNPFQDKLIIEIGGSALGLRYELSDLHGRVLKCSEIEVKSTEIDFDQFDKGIYFITLYSSNQEAKTYKLIKN